MAEVVRSLGPGRSGRCGACVCRSEMTFYKESKLIKVEAVYRSSQETVHVHRHTSLSGHGAALSVGPPGKPHAAANHQ